MISASVQSTRLRSSGPVISRILSASLAILTLRAASHSLDDRQFSLFAGCQTFGAALAPLLSAGVPLRLLGARVYEATLTTGSRLLILVMAFPFGFFLIHVLLGGKSLVFAVLAFGSTIALSTISRTVCLVALHPLWDAAGTTLDALSGLVFVSILLSTTHDIFFGLVGLVVTTFFGALLRFALFLRSIPTDRRDLESISAFGISSWLAELCGLLIVHGDVIVLWLLGTRIEVVASYAITSKLYYVCIAVAEPYVLLHVIKARSNTDGPLRRYSARGLEARRLVPVCFMLSTLGVALFLGRLEILIMGAIMIPAIHFRVSSVYYLNVLSSISKNRARGQISFGAGCTGLVLLVIASLGADGIFAAPLCLLASECTLLSATTMYLRRLYREVS